MLDQIGAWNHALPLTIRIQSWFFIMFIFLLNGVAMQFLSGVGSLNSYFSILVFVVWGW